MSEQSSGIVALLIAATIAGYLTNGMLADTLRRGMDQPEQSAQLAKVENYYE